MRNYLAILLFSLFLFGCQTYPSQKSDKANDAIFSIPFERYRLANGLTVILHQDKSDPIVAITTIVHVGSNREKPGRTGFAHFFEHMAFNDSENVPQGANRRMIEELGGSRNGGTWSDGTIYYEVVPKDALEKLMWIDSDRLGFMINTVSQEALEREKQVVKNEKRQRVDNRAYGHTQSVIRKNLYPEGHPYHWTVIGELADLQAATLEDVKAFYRRYYGPANATLVIAGDIEIDQTRALVEKWFGEISPSRPVRDLAPQPVALQSTKKRYHLDAFAKVPELRMTFPTVESYHRDSYALTALAEILSRGKTAPLYRTLVEQQKLAPEVYAQQHSSEIAGTFTIRVRANANTDLDDVEKAIFKAFRVFEQSTIRNADLEKLKIRQETDFYNDISSVLDKAFQLGTYQEYAGSPSFISQDIANIKGVTVKDITRVYAKYIQQKNFVLTSFVPRSQPELIVEGSTKAQVFEEPIVPTDQNQFEGRISNSYQKTPTRFDRSEPPLGNLPPLKSPEINTFQASNGLKILNIERRELPLVNFSLRINGGAWLERNDQLGVATLLAASLNEGTHKRTPTELEDALGQLGVRLKFTADNTGVYVNGSTLKRNFDETINLVAEMLLEPRWDAKEFERLKTRQINLIRQNEANPVSVASNAFYRQAYGANHRAGLPLLGTPQTVSKLTLNQIKAFYSRNFSPQISALHVVGDISQDEILHSIQKLTHAWQGDRVDFPRYESPDPVTKPKVFFVDIPGAKQSVIIAGKPALHRTHSDYFTLDFAQNRLGNGSSSRLFQSLRLDKGYTYGAYSQILEGLYKAPFIAYSQVRSNVTLESLHLFKDIISNYDETYTEADLAKTKNVFTKRNARHYETLDELVLLLEQVSEFELEPNFLEKQQQILNDLTVEEVRSIFRKYANEKQFIYVVAGDARTQLERLKNFGYGEPVLLNRQGIRLAPQSTDNYGQ